MNTAHDVLDILEIGECGPRKSILDKEALLARTDKKKVKSSASTLKRPENVPREVWGLQTSLNNELPPLIPTDDSVKYRQPKAVIGVSRVRRWHWTPFTNSARKDGLVLYHWRRENPDADPNEDYPFARYNKHATVPEYTHAEYESLLQDSRWSEEKTAHLMELARRFDVRFIHMRDRWDSSLFSPRPSIEDMKERYYDILAILDKERGTNLSKGLRYDAAHERRRKQQLSLLYGRTRDQVEQEQRLVQELRKIDARRRERERKKQDLQKLISQADAVVRDQDRLDLISNASESDTAHLPPPTPSPTFAIVGGQQKRRAGLSSTASFDGSSTAPGLNDTAVALGAASTAVNAALSSNYLINFADPFKNPGAHLRSQGMKLPSNLGQKKIRIIDNFLANMQIDPNPPATSEIVDAYNALRSKILLLYELRMTQLHCDYELQTARLRLETFAPDQPIPARLLNSTTSGASSSAGTTDQSSGVASQIDPTILAALKDADSKRVIIPRNSLGIAGALTAAAGTSGLFETTTTEPKNVAPRSPSPTGHRTHVATNLVGSRVAGDSMLDDSGLKRRRRAAAVEQGRVLKKLKIKGQLVDQ